MIGRRVQTYNQALEILSQVAQPLGIDSVPLEAAHHRVLAQPLSAKQDAPAFAISAMDGYAVRDEDVAQLPVTLNIIGESFAGAAFTRTLGTGEAVRIFTGAAIPNGANRVIVQENCDREGDQVCIIHPHGAARHIRAAGSDFKAAETLLPAGTLLDARALVIAAAADLEVLPVWQRPRVMILSTGDELVAPGQASSQIGSIPESVSYGVAAMVADWGGRVVGRQRLGDHLPTLEAAAKQAVTQTDLIIVTGGASVGERDYAKAMFAPQEMELLINKIAIKPGKPVWLGRVVTAQGIRYILGLPGNPTSAMVTARLLLAPLLAGLCGRGVNPALDWRAAPLAAALKATDGRETFSRARLSESGIEEIGNQDSGAQKALAAATHLIRCPLGQGALCAGQLVQILDF